MVGQRVQEFFEYFDVDSADVPRALGFFVVAKYATLATGIAVGMRFQPLRRIVLAKNLVLRSPWAQQQRLHIHDAVNHAKKYRQLRLWGPLGGQQRARVFEALDLAKKMDNVKAHEKFKLVGAGQAQFHDVKRRVKNVGRKLLLRKQLAIQQRNECLASQAQHSWHGWISKKYWHMTESLENAAGNSYFLLLFCRGLGLMPRTLAVGTAEGLLLAKLALPVTAPLSLLCIVHMLRRPNL